MCNSFHIVTVFTADISCSYSPVYNRKGTIRQCSHLVPGTVPGYDSKLDSNANTLFSKYSAPKFGLGARARVQGSDLAKEY